VEVSRWQLCSFKRENRWGKTVLGLGKYANAFTLSNGLDRGRLAPPHLF